MLEYITKKATDCRTNIGNWYYENGTEFSRAIGFGLLVTALTGAGAFSGCRGYASSAEEGLEPLREEFRTECTEENSKYDDVLEGIVDQRDDWLKDNGYRLGCENWTCQRQIDGPDEGSYLAAFNQIFCLGSKPKE